MKQHYKANKELYLTRARAWNEKNRLRKVEYARKAKDNSCTDCGVKYPYYVMQFDHLDASTKIRHVGHMVGSYGSLATLKAEIEKCELVCANCHAERTHRRRVAEGGFEPNRPSDYESDELPSCSTPLR